MTTTVKVDVDVEKAEVDSTASTLELEAVRNRSKPLEIASTYVVIAVADVTWELAMKLVLITSNLLL